MTLLAEVTRALCHSGDTPFRERKTHELRMGHVTCAINEGILMLEMVKTGGLRNGNARRNCRLDSLSNRAFGTITEVALAGPLYI